MTTINRNLTPSQIQQLQQQPSIGYGNNNSSMPAVDANTVRQISNNSVVKVDKENPLKTFLLSVPIFAGMNLAMTKFNNLCKGDYQNSFIGKLTNAVDGFAHKLKNPVTDWIYEKGKKAVNVIDNKVVKKLKITNAFFHTPTKPTFDAVVSQSNGAAGEFAHATAGLFKTYVGGEKDLAKITELGFKDLEEYENISREPHKYVDRLIELCEKNKTNPNIGIEKGFKIPFTNGKHVTEILPKWLSGIFYPQENRCEGFMNKLKSVRGDGCKTVVGKSFPKFFLRSLEGLTNGNMGGKVGMLMASYFIADAVVKTAKAPKGNGEKRKTFFENIFNLVGMYTTMGLGIKFMHMFGGFKYTGMSEEEVAKYREALNIHNEKTTGKKMGVGVERPAKDAPATSHETYKSYEEWKAGSKELKNMLKGSTIIKKEYSFGKKMLLGLQNTVLRPLKWAGRTLSVGLEQECAYVGADSSALGKFFRKAKFNVKDYGFGFPLRFLLGLMVFMPPFTNMVVKMSHKIFGRPTKSILDKEGEEKNKDGAGGPVGVQAPQMLTTQAAAARQAIPQAQAPQQVKAPVVQSQVQPQAAVQMQPVQQNSMQYQAPTAAPKAPQSVQPAQVQPKAPTEPVRSYVPSPEPVKLQPVAQESKQEAPDDKVNIAIEKSKKAEAEAMKFLH